LEQPDALYKVSACGHVCIVEALMKQVGAPVNEKYLHDGMMSLHAACHSCISDEFVKALLQVGAQVDLQDDSSQMSQLQLLKYPKDIP